MVYLGGLADPARASRWRPGVRDRGAGRGPTGDGLEVVRVPEKGAGEGGGSGFRVTDKRRAGREESGEAPPAGESPGMAAPEPAGPAAAEAPADEAHLLQVGDLVRVFIGELSARAWMHMGLIVDPATKLIARDLAQARLAIDCVAGLVEQLAPVVDKGERDELERLLADLRLNYVRQSG